MNLEIPSMEEIRQFIAELEAEKGEIIPPDDAELTKEEFALIFFKSIIQFFNQFPPEGYKPLSIYTEKGIEIQNQSFVTCMQEFSVITENGFLLAT